MTRTHPDTERGKVIALHEVGLNTKQISERVKPSQRTVSRWIQRYIADPNKNVPKSRANKTSKNAQKYTNQNVETIRRSCARNPEITARQIRQNNASLHHLSLDTINRIDKCIVLFWYISHI